MPRIVVGSQRLWTRELRFMLVVVTHACALNPTHSTPITTQPIIPVACDDGRSFTHTHQHMQKLSWRRMGTCDSTADDMNRSDDLGHSATLVCAVCANCAHAASEFFYPCAVREARSLMLRSARRRLITQRSHQRNGATTIRMNVCGPRHINVCDVMHTNTDHNQRPIDIDDR